MHVEGSRDVEDGGKGDEVDDKASNPCAKVDGRSLSRSRHWKEWRGECALVRP